MQCPNCDYLLPSKPCSMCGKELPENHKFCGFCGSKTITRTAAEAGASTLPKERLACSDGMCVGIVGEGNKCIVCGKPYSGPPA